MISQKVPHILYGGDYNPEQWPEEVWDEDVRLMREAGVNLVSLGIFSWAKLEPRPGEYDFGRLDHIFSLLHEGGVMVNLATATASPPPWLATLHPESLPVTQNGVVLHPGARQHYCPSSTVYKDRASELVRRIADRYKEHPALAMWHVNNEYGCHVSECYCDVSAEHIREWLRTRYGDLDALNEAWGTAFWSQRYGDWDEILPPRSAPTFANPTQQLDFRRFSSDALLELYEIEKEILRKATPQIPITTNFMGFFEPVDYWKWAPREDLVSDDSYPDPSDPEAHIGAAMSRDLMRSLGDGDPWVLMEQTTVRVNWRERNVPKRPNQMRLWSYGAVARGAEGIMFFQWRQSKAGAEKYHSAMVPHVRTEDSRSWREVSKLSFFSGIVDGRDHIRLGGYPAPFRDLLGLRIEDFVPMASGETNRLDTPEGGSYGCDLWADLIHLEGAEPLAAYAHDFYAGTSAVTRNVFGKGAAYYVGTRPEERYTRSLLQSAYQEAGVRPTVDLPSGVNAVRRKTEAASFLFLLNHNEEAVEIRLPNPGRDLLTGTEHDSNLVLDALEVAVLQEADDRKKPSPRARAPETG